MKRLVHSLLERRVPQLVGLYLALGWGTVEVVDWLAQRYGFPSDWADLVIVVMIALVPAAIAIAWSHGRPGPQRVTRIDLIVVPVNVVLAAVVAWALVLRSDIASGRADRTVVNSTRLTHLDALSLSTPTFLPDGHSLAVLSTDSTGASLLIVDTENPGRVDTVIRMPSASDLRWTPTDGLTFWALNDSLGGVGQFSLDIDSETVRLSCRARCSLSPSGDQVALLASPWGSHFEVHRTGEDGPDSLLVRVDMKEPAIWGRRVAWSPASAVVALRRGGWIAPDGSSLERIDIANIGSGQQWSVATRAFALEIARWANDGSYLEYRSGDRRMRQSVNAATGEPVGPAVDLGQLPTSVSRSAISPDGQRAVVSRYRQWASRLVWIDLSAGDTAAYERRRQSPTGPAYAKSAISVSPDGSAVAFHDWASRGKLSIWDLTTGTVTVRPYTAGPPVQPVLTEWNPSGTEVLVVLPGSPADFIRVAVDGSRDPEASTLDFSRTLDWCTEDEILRQLPGNRDHAFINIRTTEERRLFGERSRGWVFDPACSPDGRRIALLYNHREGQGLWLVDRDGTNDRLLVGETTAVPLGWSPDGMWVYYFHQSTHPFGVWRVPAAGGDSELVVRLPYRPYGLALARDASALVTVERDTFQDLWIIEDFDAEGEIGGS